MKFCQMSVNRLGMLSQLKLNSKAWAYGGAEREGESQDVGELGSWLCDLELLMDILEQKSWILLNYNSIV